MNEVKNIYLIIPQHRNIQKVTELKLNSYFRHISGIWQRLLLVKTMIKGLKKVFCMWISYLSQWNVDG